MGAIKGFYAAWTFSLRVWALARQRMADPHRRAGGRFKPLVWLRIPCGLVLLLALPAILVFAIGHGGPASLPMQAVIPAGHVSDSGPHKLLLPTDDRPALDRLTRLGAIQRQLDYGTFQLLVVSDRAIPALREAVLSNATLRDDFDLVAVNRWLIDTRDGEPKDLPWDRLEKPGRSKRQLYLVQFVGPAKDEWLADLTQHERAAIVAYLPSNAFAILASPAAWVWLSRETSRPSSFVQWAGAYHPAYRISAYLEDAIARDDKAVDVVVQIVEHPGAARTVADLKAQAVAVLMDDVSLQGMRDVRVRIPASLIPRLARQEDVFWIEPLPKAQLLDERQGQIVTGILNGGQPTWPGYLSWLNQKGLASNLTFTVDVADDGLDRGSTTDVHGDFKDAFGNSRVTYVLNYGTNPCSCAACAENCPFGSCVDPSGDSGGGHGNINAAIIGGYNDVQGSPSYEDAAGYQYGLGIAPYARIGASKIFNNAGCFTSVGYPTLIASAYNNGARISSNSWGLCFDDNNDGRCDRPDNTYTTDSQIYDSLVRDADSGTAGNQEMAIVFAAGNSGSGANTVTAPGTAKNVLTVGASENFRPTATGSCDHDPALPNTCFGLQIADICDGCWVPDTGADDARDIPCFSGRGPTADGRTKPDLVAPGTHIQGAASRSPNYTGTGVCDKYWPTGQTAYTWSSGTSHSTPAVAGAAALARLWFVNHRWGAPSPAMTKAFLMATATYMTGVGANDTLPSNNQGYGRLDLGRAFDDAMTIRVDQTHVFGAAGETYPVSGRIIPSSRPFRVVLAWTDAPGTIPANPWVNDLDLEVTVNGELFRGNVFSGSNSITGGTADTRNNTEAVFLPAGYSGDFSITVRATGISGDGVPGNADITDQDFALFVLVGDPPPAVTPGPILCGNNQIICRQCTFDPGSCAPRMGPGWINLPCLKPDGCRIVDPFPWNCEVKFNCPGCGSGLCPGFHNVFFSGLEGWSVGLFDPDGNPVSHDEFTTATGDRVISFRPTEENLLEGHIPNYFLVFEAGPDVKRGTTYRVGTRLEVSDRPFRPGEGERKREQR